MAGGMTAARTAGGVTTGVATTRAATAGGPTAGGVTAGGGCKCARHALFTASSASCSRAVRHARAARRAHAVPFALRAARDACDARTRACVTQRGAGDRAQAPGRRARAAAPWRWWPCVCCCRCYACCHGSCGHALSPFDVVCAVCESERGSVAGRQRALQLALLSLRSFTACPQWVVFTVGGSWRVSRGRGETS